MKVLHVVRGLANSSGTTHIVVPLSEEQARQGCEVLVYYVEKGADPSVEPDGQLVDCRSFPLTLPFSNPGVSLGFAKAIGKAIARYDFVHVHAVWNFPTFYAMRSALGKGVPYMVAPQGSFDPWALKQSSWRKKVYGPICEIPLLNKANCLQALTSREAEQFQHSGIHAPAVVIPNGVDERNFVQQGESLARRLDLAAGQRTLLFLSRLHPKKGVDVLIKAFSRFSGKRGDVTIVIAGDDAGSGYKGILMNLVSQSGIEDKCRFVGEVHGKEKFDMLLGADAFALLSHSEGLPVAVLEAMAAALPVIITRDCNLPEVAHHEAGEIVRGNIDDAAKALARVFDDPCRARTMGQNGRRLVSERFTWARIAQRTIQTYEQACARTH